MKDLKQSCQTLAGAQQGKAAIAVLAVVAVAAAGVLGFVAGKKSGPVSMGHAVPPKAGPFKAGEGAAAAAQPNPVVARVNGAEIKRQEIIDLLNAMPAQMRQVPVEQLYPMALEHAIGNKLADKRAASSSIDKDPDVQAQLWNAREQIIRANYIEKEVASRVNEDDVKAEYEKYVENFPEIEEVKAAHILVDDEKAAKDVIRKLNNGADFSELAKESSKDGSAENGGELGYFAENEVVPEFAKVAFSTEPGSYSKTPVKTEFGYHVIRVDEKRMRPPAAFDRIKPYIRQELERKELQAMLEDWKSKAKIERFDVNGNPMKAEPEAAAAESGEGVANAEPEAGEVKAAEPAAGDESGATDQDAPPAE